MWQSHKIKWDSSIGKLKDMCSSPHIEKQGDIHLEEKKYGSVSHCGCDICGSYK